MLCRSRITGQLYDDEKVVFFRNPIQSAAYDLWGAKLIDLIPNNDLKYVWVFSVEDHKKFKDKWRLRQEENK